MFYLAIVLQYVDIYDQVDNLAEPYEIISL